jgi:hypothetical protein
VADELNERQTALVKEAKAGKVKEGLPDTEDQLLALARLGHLTATYKDGEWSFKAPSSRSSKKD